MPELLPQALSISNHFFNGSIPAGSSFGARVAQISSGTFSPGSQAALAQDFINATVPTGKTANITVQVHIDYV